MAEISLQTLGARIRYYRERLGLSQDELALRVGAAQQTIQSLESGKIRKSTFLPHIAKVLGVDFDTLLSGNNLLTPATKPVFMATARRVPLFTTLDCESVLAFMGIDYELAPIHPDFPSFSGAELQSVQVLGLVLQVRRPVSSRVRLAVLEEQYR
jgi:transcriptional regulator with XRE-family HTH domain